MLNFLVHLKRIFRQHSRLWWINANAFAKWGAVWCYRSEAINTDYPIWFSVCSRIFYLICSRNTNQSNSLELEQTENKWQPTDERRENSWKAITVHSQQFCTTMQSFVIVHHDKKSGCDRSRHVWAERYQTDSWTGEGNGNAGDKRNKRKEQECIKLHNGKSKYDEQITLRRCKTKSHLHSSNAPSIDNAYTWEKKTNQKKAHKSHCNNKEHSHRIRNEYQKRKMRANRILCTLHTTDSKSKKNMQEWEGKHHIQSIYRIYTYVMYSTYTTVQ